MPLRYYILVASCLWLCACSSCNNAVQVPDNGQPVAALSSYFALPSPLDIQHRAAATGGQHRDGADYDPTHCARVSANGTAAAFSPDWDPAAPSFTDISYAVYNFTVAEEITQATLELHWQTAPEYWIGLGNTAHNRWDWRSQPAEDSLPVTLADYRTGTSVLIAIVALGATPAQLDALDLETPVAGPLRKMFFLHHSTGWGIISEGNVRGYIGDYNTAHSETFEFWDQGYNGDGPRDQDGNINGTLYDVPGDNTNPDGLNYLWTSPEADAVACRNGFLADYDVIAFKSCFPASAISDDTMLEQYKTWYLEIRDFCDTHPEKLFVVMSTPPLVPLETNYTDASRARQFAEWLKSSTYLSGHPNIVCFDLFNELAAPDAVETEPNMLRPPYRGSDPHDSHPNAVGNAAVGPVFAQFLIDSALAYTPPG
jgi:hypothetical protein